MSQLKSDSDSPNVLESEGSLLPDYLPLIPWDLGACNGIFFHDDLLKLMGDQLCSSLENSQRSLKRSTILRSLVEASFVPIAGARAKAKQPFDFSPEIRKPTLESANNRRRLCGSSGAGPDLRLLEILAPYLTSALRRDSKQ